MRVEFYDGLNHTPALGIALKAWADMHAQGLSENVVMLHWDQKAFVVFAEDQPVGVLVFDHTPSLKTLYVFIGWVSPNSRARGVYRAMWNALVEKARELKAAKISGTRTVKNGMMETVAQSLGRRDISVTMDFDVP